MVDESSRTILAFIEGVQVARNDLRPLFNHFTRRRLKVYCHSFTFGPLWAADHIAFSLVVTGRDAKNYELAARLRWSSEQWIIEADVDVEQEDEKGNFSYPVLRELPQRRASDWPTALEYLRAAIKALSDFDDVIPG